MRKRFLTVGVILTIGASLMFTSCIGNFTLTNKLLTWNKQIGNKFVNELVFICFWCLPVYEVTAMADLLVLNSIEFWSGTNPVAQGKSLINGKDGRYLVECDGKGYTITSENDGSVVRLDFDNSDRSWSVTANNETIKFMTVIDDSHVEMLTPSGEFQSVELSENGLMAYRNTVETDMFALNAN